MPDPQQVDERRGREGGRWINERPTSADFAEWFEANMQIDEGLNALDYVGGVVLIPAVDSKSKYVEGFRNGKPILSEREELAFIPYAKVETRINYFWDLMGVHQEWVAFVEGVDLPRLPATDLPESSQTVEEEGKKTTTTRPGRPDALTSLIHQLPVGFSLMTVPIGDAFTYFLCHTTLVEVYEREKLDASIERVMSLGGIGKETDIMAMARRMTPVIRRGRGTKQVPLLKGGYGSRQPYADESALMKAETGALGRALGFAGIFVIPGSGVATAEDIQEQSSGPGTAVAATEAAAEAPPEAPGTPEVTPARTGAEAAEDEQVQLKAKATALWKELSEDFPAKGTEFGQWAKQRNLSSLGAAKGAMLRGVVRKLETLLDEAKAEQAARLGGEDGTAVGAGDAAPDLMKNLEDSLAPEGGDDAPAAEASEPGPAAG